MGQQEQRPEGAPKRSKISKPELRPEKRRQVRFKLFPEQKEVIEKAIEVCMKEHGVDRSRALEHICLIYLSG